MGLAGIIVFGIGGGVIFFALPFATQPTQSWPFGIFLCLTGLVCLGAGIDEMVKSRNKT